MSGQGVFSAFYLISRIAKKKKMPVRLVPVSNDNYDMLR